MDKREQQIIDFIKKKKGCSSKEIFENVAASFSYPTLKRVLADLKAKKFLLTKGQGKGTKYLLSPAYDILAPVDIEKYYQKEVDERQIIESFNPKIVQILGRYTVFTQAELEKLESLQKKHLNNISDLAPNEYQKELERLAIDLSWKSSQIEGNTYSLLETERLLKEKETTEGKTKEEAVMLLNHKTTLDFIIANTNYLNPLTTAKIEDIHFLLIKELAIQRNLRKRRVGISGTNYKPLDNEFQIAEALKNSCQVINKKKCVFEKALLALVLISYIQPFMDGNKRTARIVSNAILLNNDYCPVSFRTVNSIDYKKAMLIFYEQNKIANFKEIFIDQFEFAVKNYF